MFDRDNKWTEGLIAMHVSPLDIDAFSDVIVVILTTIEDKQKHLRLLSEKLLENRSCHHSFEMTLSQYLKLTEMLPF